MENAHVVFNTGNGTWTLKLLDKDKEIHGFIHRHNAIIYGMNNDYILPTKDIDWLRAKEGW